MAKVKPPVVAWGEPQIRKALTLRYPPPQYALLSNVSCGVGRVQRFADALVMSLFPSRGLGLIGFEIKSTRSDWLRELKNPAKADPIFQYCNRWYLTVANAEVVKEGELPEPWGLLVMNPDGGLRQSVAAPSLVPNPLDAPFVAAIFRRAGEQAVDAKLLRDTHDDAFKEGRDKGYKENANGLKYATERLEESLKRVSEFEAASGLSISGWTQPRELGDAVRRLLKGEAKDAERELRRLRATAARVVAMLDGALSTDTTGEVEV